APGVLVVIDQHASGGALRDAVFGGDQLWMLRLERFRELFGEGPDLLLQRPTDDGDVDVNAARASGFGIAGDIQRVQRFAYRARGFEHLSPSGGFAVFAHDRIEI